MVTMENVSVIIATINRPTELIRCLESIANQTYLPYEVVIVDDGELDPESIRRVIREPVHVQYHRKSPPGLSASRNLGARVAGGTLLLFLDDDVVLESSYIEEIARVFEEDTKRQIGGVCGIVLNRKAKPVLFRYWARLFLLDRGREGAILPWGFYTKIQQPERVIEVEWIPGGLSCFRREVFEQFQISDLGQTGRHGSEDAEFSWRISGRFVLKATPFARLYHYPPPRTREQNLETGFKQTQGHCLLFERHAVKTLKTRVCFTWAMTGLVLGNLGSCLFAQSREDRIGRLLQGWGNLKGLLTQLSLSNLH